MKQPLLTLISAGVWGVILPPFGFSLISQTVKLQPWHFAVFSKVLLETSPQNLASLVRPSLQILAKTQTGIFLISRFLVNPL